MINLIAIPLVLAWWCVQLIGLFIWTVWERINDASHWGGIDG